MIPFRDWTIDEVLMARIAYITLVVALAAYVSYVFFSNHMRACQGALCTGCCGNLMNFGSALEKYAKQHNGKYPDDLQKLIPIYLHEIPKCPAGKYSIYSKYEYMHSSKPEAYTVYCRGDFHSPMYFTDCPEYSSFEGDSGNFTFLPDTGKTGKPEELR
jgi:hypothetical protein